MNIVRIFLIICIQFIVLKSQEIPNEFFEFKTKKLLYDFGKNWNTKTTLGSIRKEKLSQSLKSEPFNNEKLKLDSLAVDTRFGVLSHNDASSIYVYGHASKKNFYWYLYSRIVSSPTAFDRYTGKARDIDRFGFNSGETDISGVGYSKDWLILQIGRGRQRWSAGEGIDLMLSEDSPAYDYGLFGLNFRNIKGRFFHGFLESDSLINRYITGRGVEWTNHKNLNMSLSELVVYSGMNRPIDFAYFNPISSHLEIELNDRQNKIGTNSGNGAWQLSMDIMAEKGFRFSGNFLIDEYILDDIQLDSGKINGIAWSARASWTSKKTEKYICSLYGSYIYVGTHTFRHQDGYNNFVQRNKPLGWQNGSDGEEIKIGLKYFNKSDLILNLEIINNEIGSNSLIHSPYKPYSGYKRGAFPSGIINSSLIIVANFQWWWKPKMSFFSEINYSKFNDNSYSADLIIGIDFFIANSLKF